MATLPPFDNTSWTSVSSSSLAESIRRCKMGSSGAAFCSRVVLVVMNVAMLLGGLTLLGLDIWIRVDPHFETELRQSLLNESGGTVEEARGSLRVGILVAFWTLAGFGFAAAVLGLLGALGAAFRSRALLGLSLAATVVLALLELAVGIFVLVYRSK
uniref:DUF4064 domain-containing protein n=1 Tax=Steinernema glaseri TaxID=37863 RepID=A0A1I8AK10_9BILA